MSRWSAKTPAETDETTDVISVTRFWKKIAEKKRDAGKAALLSNPNHLKIIARRMTTANELLAAGKKPESDQIFHLFREVFYGEKELEAWLDFAKSRIRGDRVPMPDLPADTDDSKKPE